MPEPKGFNIRVYGIVIAKNHVLLSDEFRLGQYMTKFPGGGLELGEGTLDCIRREFKEELNQEVDSLEHFYTTDFCQVSNLLDPPMQIISIYYLVGLHAPYKFNTTNIKFNIPAAEGNQAFRWMPLDTISPEELTLPIDKVVAEKLKAGFKR